MKSIREEIFDVNFLKEEEITFITFLYLDKYFCFDVTLPYPLLFSSNEAADNFSFTGSLSISLIAMTF